MKILLFVLCIFSTIANAFEKNEAQTFCRSYLNGLKSQSFPIKGLDGSIFFKYEVSCDSLTAKHYRQTPNNLIKDLRTDLFKKNSIEFYCDTMQSSRKYGMTFVDIYFDMNLKHISTTTVSPKDCN